MNPSHQDAPFVPRMDLLVCDSGDLMLKFELSGIRSKDLDITVEDNKIRIRGKRPDLDADRAQRFLIKEIPAGPFEAVLEIPKGFALSAARAAFVNGVLRVIVPPEQQRTGRFRF